MEETSLERAREREREREREEGEAGYSCGKRERRRKGRERGLDLSTRRLCNYFSVPVSFSRGRELHPVHLHPSGYRDCGLARARARASLRASVPLAAGHP